MATGSVSFERVWKKFRRGEVHDSLRDLVPSLARRLIGGTRSAKTDLGRNEFWALADVSFEVGPGQALGIIGPNGAGKSTILKLLTRILRPTAGRCRVDGRIGSLIEIAAGFHPDLTGRENLFLQGAIRGVSRAYLRQKFDEIVSMAELEDFIDTPVKRYSSGMNARLGFAIAVHLDPDVLIIDEVLSVGDYAFQRKAFGRIRAMIGTGIPVVVVSHQLERIVELCGQAILLNRGSVVRHGTPRECVTAYLSGVVGNKVTEAGSSAITLSEVAIKTAMPVQSGDRVPITVSGTTSEGAPRHHVIGLVVRDLATGVTVFATETGGEELALPASGPFQLDIDLQANMGRGLYAVETMVWDPVQRRETAQGPHAVIEMAEEQGFHGSINLHVQMRMRRESALTPFAAQSRTRAV